MNDTLSLLRSRRSVSPNMLTEPGPTPDEIQTLLLIAARVPDHGRLAPWRFIVLAGDARRRIGDTIAEVFRSDEPEAAEDRLMVERTRLSRAPVVVAVVSRAQAHVKIPDWEQVLSAGAVCMNLVIAANAMSYGSAWLTEWFAFDRRVLDVLGLAPEERIAGFIHIGTPKEPPLERLRPALADLVTWL